MGYLFRSMKYRCTVHTKESFFCTYIPITKEQAQKFIFTDILTNQKIKYLGMPLLERLFSVVFFLKPKNTVCLQSNKISQSNKSTL